MASNVSVIGLGSENMLNKDMIDTLKEAQRAATINPVEYQQEVAIVQKEAVENVKNKISDLHKWTAILTEPDNYNTKEVYTTNSNALFEVTDNDSIVDENFSMEVTALAQRDVYQTAIISDILGTVSDTEGSFDITINGETTKIDIGLEDTYISLVGKINAIEGVETELVKVNSNGEYRLKIRSSETGETNAITINNVTAEIDNVLNLTNPDNHILTASDAIITLDGVDITRSNNTIDDLVEGISITLYEPGNVEVQVVDNVTSVVEAYNNFILEYNALFETVNSYRTNIEEGETSALLGINEVSQGMRNLKSSLFSINENADVNNPEEIKSIFQAGFDFDQTGTLSTGTINKTIEVTDDFGITSEKVQKFSFEQMIASNTAMFKDFFTAENSPLKDVLSVLNGMYNIDGVTDSEGNTLTGSFDTVIKKFETQDTAYTKRIEELQEKLDLEYEQMQIRFAQFDTIINNMNSAFSSVQMLIDQSTSGN